MTGIRWYNMSNPIGENGTLPPFSVMNCGDWLALLHSGLLVGESPPLGWHHVVSEWLRNHPTVAIAVPAILLVGTLYAGASLADDELKEE